MLFSPLESDAPAIIYIDFKSPYAFIACQPYFELEEKLNMRFDWRPLTLDIPSFLGSARLDNKGKVAKSTRSPAQWTTVKYFYRDARRYAALNEFTLRGTEKIWDSSLAAMGLMWVKQQSHECLKKYIQLVYEPFWKRELDIENLDVIVNKLSQCGANCQGFKDYSSGPGRIEHEAQQSAIFEQGIFGVPSVIIDKQIYFGREHLPRIEWLLSGKTGAAPDIAYQSVNAKTSRTSDNSNLPDENPGQGSALQVCIDFKNPDDYLALKPTLKLAESLNLQLDWLPFIGPGRPTLHGDLAQGIDNPSRGDLHRQLRRTYFREDFLRYAEVSDLLISRLEQPADSKLASLGLLWCKQQHPAAVDSYVESIFNACWQSLSNISDEAVVLEAMDKAGACTDGFTDFSTTQGTTQLEKIQSELKALGIFDSPFYLLDQDRYLGRQHLPILRWLLEGKQGQKPI